MAELVDIRLKVKLYYTQNFSDEPGTIRKATIEENGFARLQTQNWIIVAPEDYEIYIPEEDYARVAQWLEQASDTR